LACFNTLSSSELERRREIGVLRSMGAIGRSVEAISWTEAMVLWVSRGWR
jgi:ABC-type antimicrobial peptide transport system permease subunit